PRDGLVHQPVEELSLCRLECFTLVKREASAQGDSGYCHELSLLSCSFAPVPTGGVLADTAVGLNETLLNPLSNTVIRAMWYRRVLVCQHSWTMSLPATR